MVLVHTLSIPETEHLVHQNRPFWRTSLEVVLDRPILECDEIMLLIIRRDGDILACVRTAFMQSLQHIHILTVMAPGAASMIILFNAL
jgi:hypothetical protein